MYMQHWQRGLLPPADGSSSFHSWHRLRARSQDLIGSHHGETASLTSDACKRARNGVLFIDEAYALRAEGSSDSAGQVRQPLVERGSHQRPGHHPRGLQQGDGLVRLVQLQARVALSDVFNFATMRTRRWRAS